MLAPNTIVHDPPSLLGDVRQALSLRRALADFPARLAEHLEVGKSVRISRVSIDEYMEQQVVGGDES